MRHLVAQAARSKHPALAELVEAQREYDAALAHLDTRRTAKPGASHPSEPERAIIRARESALHAARAFDRAHGAMHEAQLRFERALALLGEARQHIGGVGESSEDALKRAEQIVAIGRARLIAAGEALGRAREEL